MFKFDNISDDSRWIDTVSNDKIASYIYDMLLGVESMAERKGMLKLACLVAEAANEAERLRSRSQDRSEPPRSDL